MKRVLVLLFAIVSLSSLVTLAADPLGAPKAGLGQGKFGVGVEYSYTEMSLMREYNGIWGRYDIDEMHTTYLTGSYGVTDWLEVFLRLGMVNLESSDESPYFGGSLSFNNDYDTDFIYGGGIRATLGCAGPVTFGAVATYSYADLNGDFDSTWSFFYGDVDMEMQQIQVALGATWNVSERMAIYGGALMHHVRIDQDRVNHGGSPSSDLLIKNDDGGSMFGGYVGLEVGIIDNLVLSVEGSYTGDSKGGSASLGWKF